VDVGGAARTTKMVVALTTLFSLASAPHASMARHATPLARTAVRMSAFKSARRTVVLSAALACSSSSQESRAASTPNDKRDPAVVAKVMALDKEAVVQRGAAAQHQPKLTITTSDLFKVAKVVMTVPPVTTADDYVEFMYMKDAVTGSIVACKAFDATTGLGGEADDCNMKLGCATSSLVMSIDKGKSVVPVVLYHLDGRWETPPVRVDCPSAGGNKISCLGGA